ncbi:MAG: Trm112 family protein [Aquificaceae bacterium]|nr:Trm112 family protein [Aquificaceae bacterium]MCS7196914.1 Trm112 family protein [Aquificaceae bacterium]MCX7989357.1 Trm112 family protein [Aquificaceae bacterium]MDW8032917.1 Trm112 family protein [Aquificaceae bacterium]MDW8295022.1 Trm112 family protein [Aquificaceae bacterium]
MLSKELLDILACPKCKGDLIYYEDKDILVCPRCKVYYPVEEDIPILLIDSARPLEELEKVPQGGQT